MSAEKLAFLQNFYTDVTLYVPADAKAFVPPVAAADAGPLDAPAAVPLVAAPATAIAAPPPPQRQSIVPNTGFSKPSAGLERLTSNILAAPATLAAGPTSPPPVVAQAPPGVAPAMLTPFATLGTNAAGVLLLCRLPHAQFVKLHRNVFLNKMLQALGLVMEDVILVNVEAELPVALANLRRQLDATHIVAFGKNLLDVTIRNTQIYEPVLFPNLNLSYLASATIDLVEYDVSLKKRLWPGLKAMFQH